MHVALLLSLVLADIVEAHTASFVCPPDSAMKHISYSVPSGAYFLPVLASQPPGTQTKKAIVVVHGQYNSDQPYYFQTMMKHIHYQDLAEDIVVIAPGFPDKTCNEQEWNNGSSSLEALEWSKSTHQWTFGFNSDGKDGRSSFQAMDDLVTWIEKEYQINELIVTGFSAGGQMVLRWAIMSPHGTDGNTTGGLPLRIIVGSPSTYEYLSAKRPDRSCIVDETSNVGHRCAKFSTPQLGRRLRGNHSGEVCKGAWDNYGYGLSGLQKTPHNASDLANMKKYLQNTIKGAPEYADFIPRCFRTKDFRLGVGKFDNFNCKRVACSDNCASMLQGSNRLQRALNYKAHLEDVFPGYVTKFGAFEGGHDFSRFYSSRLFFGWVMPGHVVKEPELTTKAPEDTKEPELTTKAPEDTSLARQKFENRVTVASCLFLHVLMALILSHM